MSYHTTVYLFLFLPLALLAYQAAPRRFRWMVLLIHGYLFFWLISGKLLAYLLGATLVTHDTGICLAWLKLRCSQEVRECGKEEAAAIKKVYKKRQRQALTVGILLLLSVLAYLKYYNFFIRNANAALGLLGQQELFPMRNLLLPIGISFYTLQAIGYLADVYWEKIPAEKHLGKLALFLAFFPQIMEGPVSRYSQTADALWSGEPLKRENLSSGCVRIFWGLFKKMIIADRLYIAAETIFERWQNYHGVMIAVGAIAYTIQLYMEFSGGIDIVIGSGKLFGVTLPENFRQPFAARNAAEFWRRWHISLGTWLKDYVFYPVSASAAVKKWNRFGKKHAGRYLTKLGVTGICLFPVWFINGLWHGPRWSYLFYGMYYFAILFAGAALEPVRTRFLKACHINENAWYWRNLQILKTWVIIFTGELFFRANGLSAGLRMFMSLFRDFQTQRIWDGTLLSLGLDKADYFAVCAGCAAVAIVGMIKERKLLGEEGLNRLWTPLRWTVYYGLILAVVIFGAYGIGYQQVDLIYAGF